MSSMKVSIVHNIPIHYKHLLFNSLAEKGLDINIIYVSDRSDIRFETPDLETAKYKYKIGSHKKIEQTNNIHTAVFTWKSLSRSRPDVVIISGWYGIAPWVALMWRITNRVPAILWSESNAFDRKRSVFKEFVKRLYLKGFQAAHVYGQSSRDYLIKLGFNHNKIWIKRTVVDVELFRIQASSHLKSLSEKKLILYVGRFSEEKNLSMVLKAIGKLTHDSREALKFRFIGYGPLEDRLKTEASILGIGDSIEFIGKVSHSDLPKIYREADVFLLPSTSEPWGLVANEAMISELPVIASDNCGCTADLIRRDTGWRFPAKDTSALQDILNEIALLPRSTLREMGNCAAALSSQYSPSNCADIVIGSLKAIAG